MSETENPSPEYEDDREFKNGDIVEFDNNNITKDRDIIRGRYVIVTKRHHSSYGVKDSFSKILVKLPDDHSSLIAFPIYNLEDYKSRIKRIPDNENWITAGGKKHRSRKTRRVRKSKRKGARKSRKH